MVLIVFVLTKQLFLSFLFSFIFWMIVFLNQVEVGKEVLLEAIEI